MANINFPTRTPVGVIIPNQIAPPEGSITIRVTPVVGNGSNGGSSIQRGYPDVAQMIDAQGNVLAAYAKLTPVADGAYGDATGSPIPMKLTKIVPPYNSGTGLPSHYDLVFDPYGTTAQKLAVVQHHEFELKAVLPVIWLSLPMNQVGAPGEVIPS